MTAYLFIEQGPRSGTQHLLDQPLIVAGRDQDCQLRLPDTFVSRRQFQIEARNGHYVFENLAPEHNLTLVNGRNEAGCLRLEDKDLIQTGATRLRFRDGIPVEERPESSELVGSSWQTERLRKQIGEVARTSAPILLRGDVGTGKTLAARAIHAASGRDKLVIVSCTMVAQVLTEYDGTLFLDEVSALPLDGQTKLLGLLDSTKTRVVASTTRDLPSTFDRELAVRLAATKLELLPLVSRKDDIADLARHFLARFEKALETEVTLTPAAVDALRAHDWPGNVRELDLAMQRAVIFHPGAELDRDAFDLEPTITNELGKDLIHRALVVTNQSRRAAANALQISRSRLYEHVTRYGLG